jgi:methyl-accepting chemotaxis protein
MRATLADYRIYEYRHILTTDPSQMAAVEALLASERARFISAEQSYKPLISDATEQRLFAEFKAMEEEYLNMHEQLLSLSRNNRNSEAFEIIRGKATSVYDACRVRLQAVITHNRTMASQASAESRQRQGRALVIAISFALLLFAVVLALHLIVGKMVVVPMLELDLQCDKQK